MAKEFVGKSTLTALIELIKGEFTKVTTSLSGKVNTTDIVNDLTSTETGKPLSAAQGKALKEMIAQSGNGDMLRDTYDKDGDDIVDEAKHAQTADSAARADTAAKADTATTAETANKATTADTATTATNATNAANADKLDGHDAEEFLLDEDLTEIGGDAVTQLWGN